MYTLENAKDEIISGHRIWTRREILDVLEQIETPQLENNEAIIEKLNDNLEMPEINDYCDPSFTIYGSSEIAVDDYGLDEDSLKRDILDSITIVLND